MDHPHATHGIRNEASGAEYPGNNLCIVIMKESPSGDTVTATFELTVEGEPPARTYFSASIGAGCVRGAPGRGRRRGVCHEPAGSAGRGERGPDWRQDPSNPNDSYAPLVSGTIKDFGTAQFDEDETFYATISFEDGNGKLLKSIAGGAKGLLSNTGGGEMLAMLGGGLC